MTTGCLTNAYENKVVDHVGVTAAISPPAAIYMGLYTTLPGDDGTGGVEVTGDGYAREAVTWGAASLGAVANDAEVEFTTAAEDWGTVVGIALFDALAGTMIARIALDAEVTVEDGDVIAFAVGAITLSFDTSDGVTTYAANKLLDLIFNATAWALTQLYVGLYLVSPDAGGGGTPVTGGSYARQAVDFAAASGGTAVSSAQVDMPTATADWGSIAAIAYHDAASGGNVLVRWSITPKAVVSGETPSFGAGLLSLFAA